MIVLTATLLVRPSLRCPEGSLMAWLCFESGRIVARDIGGTVLCNGTPRLWRELVECGWVKVDAPALALVNVSTTSVAP